VRSATSRAARALERKAEEIGFENVSEIPSFHDAFRHGLIPEYDERVLPSERHLKITDWEAALEGRVGALGGVDVVVTGIEKPYAVLAELKWCRKKYELGWTLWDIYKLAAAQAQYAPDASYAVVGAPIAYCEDLELDCARLFATGSWNSLELFSSYWRAWHDLLHDGAARPSSVPVEISTVLVADERLDVSPEWSIRVLRVAAASQGLLPFEGDWPRGLARCDRKLRTTEPIRGCMLGGAVGDALGAPVEFLGSHEITDAYGADGITELAEAYGRVGAITDDTQMALFTAEGLMRAQNRALERGLSGIPDVLRYAYQRWLYTQRHELRESSHVRENLDGWLIEVPELHAQRAPGATCLSALESGLARSVARPLNNSKGCGGVMRIAPVGLLLRDGAFDVFDVGCEIAAITHGHPAGYLSAGYLASVVAQVVAGEPLWNAAIKALDELKTKAKGFDKELYTQVAECRTAIEHALDLAARGQPSREDVVALGEGWVAEEALAIALYCALTADHFRDGVVLAVNHGGDSDSTGAIAGNILGALFGAEAIPQAWLACLELRAEIEALASDLVRHADKDFDPEGDEVESRRYPAW
jgi:ADP-ribosylglycohydrolase